MKKILSFILCIAMILSMSVTALASNITFDGGVNETLVTYGMSEGFTVTIPTDFTIDNSGETSAEVSASHVMLAHGNILEVTVSGHDYESTGSWELVDEAEATNMLTYTIGSTDGASDIVNNSVVLAVEAGEAWDETITKIMYFTVVDELINAGNYKDTLTFTVGIVAGSIVVDKSVFANNSWNEIITAVQNNEVPDTWKVGDAKRMTIGDIDYNIRIIGKNHDTYTSGGTAPLTLELRGVYKENIPMNETNDNTTGWSGSAMRNTTLPTILSQMPFEVQNAIKAVDKQTLKGDKSGLETTSDKLFLLSESEVFGTTSNSNGFIEGSRYEFYINNIARKSYNQELHYWWLRSPYYDNSISFSCVNLSGKLSNNNSGAASSTGRASFAFCF